MIFKMLLYFLVPLLAAAGPIGRSTGSNRPLTLSRRDFHFEDDRSYLQSRSAITSQRLQPRVDIFGPPGEPEGAEFLDIIPAQVEARRLDPTKEVIQSSLSRNVIFMFSR
jgi:hypothetical protein